MTGPASAIASGSCMSMSDFEELFAKRAIRTWVDWDGLDDSNCKIGAVVIATREALRSCHTVWYRNAGAASDWRDPRAHRVLVGEEADRLATPRSEALDVPLVFPALALGGGEVMLLDGNHRAVALAASHHPVHVMLIVLEGPRTPLVFPDLIHETHALDPPSRWRDWVSAIEDKFGHPPEGAD